MGVNGDLRDRAIRHALATNGYSRQLSDDIVRLLNSADADIVETIAKRIVNIERGMALSRTATARLNALLTEIRAINSAIYQQVHDQLSSDLQDFGDTEASFQRDTIVKALPSGLPDIAITLPGPVVLKAIVETRPIDGSLLSSWTDTMDVNRVARIERAIQLGLTRGAGTDDIVRRIRGTKASKYSDGVLDISRRSLQTLVRTGVTHVSNQAAQETWRQNSRVVDSWQFLATLDDRTTPVCASNDGLVSPIGQGPIPPLHPRCRSISVAVTKSWKDLGIDAADVPPPARASMDGQVAGGTKFDGWLRGKDAATQNKVLGRTRADLWRSGKLDLQDFVKNGDTLMTLDQLRAAHKSILS